MNVWKVSLGGKLFLCHFVTISTVLLLVARGVDFFGPGWTAPFSYDHLSWLLLLLSLPLFFPAVMPQIDGGWIGEMTFLAKFLFQLLILCWMTANSLIVGYGTAKICKLIAFRKHQKEYGS